MIFNLPVEFGGCMNVWGDVMAFNILIISRLARHWLPLSFDCHLPSSRGVSRALVGRLFLDLFSPTTSCS
jgi:hypothetical protein